MQRGTKVTRDGGLKIQCLACYRMMESQAESVQAHAAARVILAAVLAIANYRMANVGHVDTYLILASCQQVKKKQRTLVGLFHQFPFSSSPLAAVINRTAHHDHTISVVQPTLHPALWFFHDTFDHSDITTVDDSAVPVLDHLLLGINALGIDNESRSACIQSMHNMGSAMLTGLDKMPVEQCLHVQTARANRH